MQMRYKKIMVWREANFKRADQLLMNLMYWREYRTQFHIADTYAVSETTVFRTIYKAVDALVCSGQFHLPCKKVLYPSDTHNFRRFKGSRTSMTLQVLCPADADYQGLATLHAISRTSQKRSKLQLYIRNDK